MVNISYRNINGMLGYATMRGKSSQFSSQRPLQVDFTTLTPSETLFYERQLFTALSRASIASPNCTFSGPPAANA